jgi:hypothetical protein
MYVHSIPTLRDAALEVYSPGPESPGKDILFHCADVLNRDDGIGLLKHIELSFVNMRVRSIDCKRTVVDRNPCWDVRMIYQTRTEDWVLMDGEFISKESGYVYRPQRPTRARAPTRAPMSVI